MKEFSEVITFTWEEIPELTLDKVYERYRDMALRMGEALELHLIRTIKDAVEKVGNVVDVKGKALSPEDFFEMLLTLQIDFNPDGTAHFPHFVASEEVINALMKVLAQLEEEPYKTRFAEVIEQKRQEWNARESNRKLVG